MKISFEKQWHKWVFLSAAVLVIASWVIAIYYWGKLPTTIATHFNISGQADSWNHKSIWYSFMMPVLQTIMLIGFGLLYRRPKYTNMPTTLLLDTLDKPKRDHAFGLIRNMLAVTTLLIGLFFTYLTYALHYSALHSKVGLLPYVIIIWIVVLFGWLIWYNVKVYRTTKGFIAKSTNKK